MNEMINHTSTYMYSHNGKKPSKNVEPFYEERFEPPLMPPTEHETYSIDGENTSRCKPEGKEEKDDNRPGTTTFIPCLQLN